jgi:hypothetical protein
MSAETFVRLTVTDTADGIEEKMELSVDWRAHDPVQLGRRLRGGCRFTTASMRRLPLPNAWRASVRMALPTRLAPGTAPR